METQGCPECGADLEAYVKYNGSVTVKSVLTHGSLQSITIDEDWLSTTSGEAEVNCTACDWGRSFDETEIEWS